jgi:hypothetical protein
MRTSSQDYRRLRYGCRGGNTVLLHRHDDVAPFAQDHGNDALGMTEEQLHCMVDGETAR